MAGSDESKLDLHQVLGESEFEVIFKLFEVKGAVGRGLTKSRFLFISGITFEEFKQIIHSALPEPLSIPDEDLLLTFKKIDLHATGRIDWEGFITHILTSLQRDATAGIEFENIFNSSTNIILGSNHDAINSIDITPYLSVGGEMNYSAYRYVTASRDGLVAVWSPKWTLIKQRWCWDEPFRNPKKFPWIMDMVCLPNVQLVALSNTDETIQLFDLVTASIELIYLITEIDAIVTCMNFWFDEKNPDLCILVFGDNAGHVTLINFTKSISLRLFGNLSNEVKEVKLPDILRNKYMHVIGVRYECVYEEWVQQVKYLPTIKSLISCADSSKVSMILVGTTFLDSDPKYFVVHKGITCFDYHPVQGVIITGSVDKCLRIWNPYIPTKAIAVLTGHNSPIRYVIVIEEKLLFISISEDKYIKVWDLQEQLCIQTLQDKSLMSDIYRITSAMYNFVSHLIVIGTFQIFTIENRLHSEGHDKTIYSHNKPLVGILYSPMYNYIISCCENSTIIFWDLETGLKKVQVNSAHWSIVNGFETPAGITAMAIDETGHRLITSAVDGQLKLWSLTNGSLLKSLTIPEGKNINTILCYKQRIFFSGWSKQVYVCSDELQAATLKSWKQLHSDDIIGMSLLTSQQILTASWDGKIIIWTIGTGTQLSIFSLHHQYVYHFFPDLRPVAQALLLGVHLYDVIRLAPQKTPIDIYHPVFRGLSVPSIKRKRKDKLHIPSLESLSKKKESTFPALQCMITLMARISKPNVVNTLVSDVEGFIQCWFMSRKGGLISLFSGVSIGGHRVSCMTTDQANKYVFTGDTSGFIRVWYIRNYFSDEADNPTKEEQNEDMKLFPFSKKSFKLIANRVLQELETIHVIEQLQFVNNSRPFLLSSFQGHLQAITQVEIIEIHNVMLTASKDKTIRMWAYSGAYLRTLGETTEWSLNKALTTPVKPMQRDAPFDIRRVGTAPTLQVIFGGISPRWYRVREFILKRYVTAAIRQKSLFPSSEPAIAKKDTRKDSIIQRLQEQELVYLSMKSPLGDFFKFKEREPESPALPTLSRAFTEMRAVFAYLDSVPLAPISLDPCVKYLDSHRLSSRLKPNMPT